MAELKILDLDVNISDTKKIIKGLNLSVKGGELHVLMGPNGSGKSTLANAIFGNPKYIVKAGKIELDGENLLSLKVDERARKGLFLAFQEPVEVPGVNVMNFLRIAFGQLKPGDPQITDFRQTVVAYLKRFGLAEHFLKRALNEGFSGGEKKRFELLQAILFSPKIAVLDELDSGLDMDSVKTMAEAVREQLAKGTGILMITHSEKMFEYLKPDFIHIMVDGKIVRSGGSEIASELHSKGYAGLGG